jgi:SAM-dependent methyltransferase
MHPDLLEILRCPRTGQKLVLEDAEYRSDRVYAGSLASEDRQNRYPIRSFIPRFVPESNYADNFGMQWNKFRQTQLDSHSGQAISARRFWNATGWQPEDVAGKWVLDAGCGAGRFAEIALKAGAVVVALDYSSASDACYANLGPHPNLHVVQGDIYSLPFVRQFFPFVYSLGVLQHTPDVRKAFSALPPMVANGGRLCVDYYWRRLRTLLHTKYLFRPVTKHLPKEKLFKYLQSAVPVLLPISQKLGRTPRVGRLLQRLVPVADYTGIYPLNQRQLEEWALLDTFDMLSPRYDNPQTVATARGWLVEAGFTDVKVFHEGQLVGRGRKPS